MKKWITAVIAACVLLANCGVKAPPVPPDYTPPPAVTDLGYTLEANGSVALSWSLFGRDPEVPRYKAPGYFVQKIPLIIPRVKIVRAFSIWSRICVWNRAICFTGNRCKKGSDTITRSSFTMRATWRARTPMWSVLNINRFEV